MSTKELDHNHRYEIKSPDDVSQLISKFAGKGKSNKVIWLALIGVFIDAYDLTTLSFGIEQVITAQSQMIFILDVGIINVLITSQKL